MASIQQVHLAAFPIRVNPPRTFRRHCREGTRCLATQSIRVYLNLPVRFLSYLSRLVRRTRTHEHPENQRSGPGKAARAYQNFHSPRFSPNCRSSAVCRSSPCRFDKSRPERIRKSALSGFIVGLWFHIAELNLVIWQS